MRDYDVTSAGISAEQDRHHRMKVYFIMMAIRMACVMSLLWVRGWWILVAALGGVLLPYIAVIFANEPKHTRGRSPERPQPLELENGTTHLASQEQPLIVVDEPASRRPSQGPETTDDTIPTLDPEYLSREDDAL